MATSSYILQLQDFCDPKPSTIGVYALQSDAISARNTLVTQDITTFQTNYPTSTFDTVTSNDGLATFIRKNDTNSYTCTFDQTTYAEVICSTSGQLVFRAYAVSQITNP